MALRRAAQHRFPGHERQGVEYAEMKMNLDVPMAALAAWTLLFQPAAPAQT